ncbi:MAG: M4 family metallopeptidase [Candidatus Kerfeldbacteria bacterium]|nr:M4 family metallopeptidase [Candidatus Kerfeldbacteria bacterium]
MKLSAPILSLSISGLLLAHSTVGYELSSINQTVDDLGIEHVTYQQRYQGVPIFGGQVKWHHNQATGQRFVTGQTSTTIAATDVTTTPTLSADEATVIAQGLANVETTVRKQNFYLFNPRLLNKLQTDTYTLVWEIELYQSDPLFHEYYYIDAQTGALVYQIHGVQHAITRQIYDCSYFDGNCYIDSTDPVTGYTYGRSEGQPARGDNPYWYIVDSLTDTDNLYDNLGNVYNYYLTKFARNGANGNHGMGDGSNFAVADTTGLTYIDYYSLEADSCPNAFFDGVGSMHYCDGYVTNDISGHEYAHAVNYFSILDANGAPAGLSYTYEIGALNEANSDVFGEALEYYVTGANDWLIGAELSTGALRSMSDPTTYTYTNEDGDAIPYPDRYNSENLYCGEGDSGGVHLNSSVVNKAAYLMAMGGTFNGCTITALGRDKEEAIFYRAQTTYYTTTTDFNQAYTALLAACADLYSNTDCHEVQKALLAVELDQAGFCSGEAAVVPDCASVDATPTITSVTSDTANGYYKLGSVIDIDVTFSEAVSGDVTVTLETGQTDRSCSFTAAAETTGTCDYTVRAADTSSDLTVNSITGTITDSSGDAVTATTPTTNLAANHAIVIDTTKPLVPTKLKIYTSPHHNKRIKTINPSTFKKILKAQSLKPYFIWAKVADAKHYYVTFSNKPMTRAKLLNSKNKRTQNNLRGTVAIRNKKYYLYMLLQDRAGNRSKVKTLLTYKAE